MYSRRICLWFLITRHFERNSLRFGQIWVWKEVREQIRRNLGSIWKYFELETWNFGLKSADSASLRNSSRTIDLLVDEPEIWLRRNKSIFLWLWSNWWKQQIYSYGCCQIGGLNRLWFIYLKIQSHSLFDLLFKSYKLIALPIGLIEIPRSLHT